MGKPFTQIITDDHVGNRVQANITNAISGVNNTISKTQKSVTDLSTQLSDANESIQTLETKIAGSPFGGGVLLANVTINGSNTTLTHGLGRTPTVWLNVDQTVTNPIIRTGWNSNTITLQSTATITASIWVG